jgi:polysaccharide biosynthesis transport protein
MYQPAHPIKPAGTSPPESLSGGGLDLNRIWSIAWPRKRTIITTTAVTFLAVFIIATIIPHQFTAVTQILIDPSDLRVVENGLTPNNVSQQDALVLQVESQVRVLTSDNVLRRVIKTEGLDHDPEFTEGPFLYRLVTDLFPPLAFDQSEGNFDPTLMALNQLQKHLRVRRAERTYVVDVAVSTETREKSVRIANTIAQAYLDEQASARSDTARRTSDSLSARLNELKERVRRAEEKAEAFKARNNIVNASGQLISEQQLHELNNQLGLARARTGEMRARVEQVERAQQAGVELGAFSEAVQSQTLTPLRAQYAEIMRREAEQMTTLGARHPAVIEIQAQAARLRRVIAEEISRISLATRSDYERARANEETLTRSLTALSREAMTTNEALVQLRELERDVQAGRAVYESFLVRARETGEQQTLDTKNVRVISKADVPLRRSWPPSNLILAIGALVLGLAAGTGLTLWKSDGGGAPPPSRSRTRIAEPPQAPAPANHYPMLAVVPTGGDSKGWSGSQDGGSRVASEMRRALDVIRANHTGKGAPCILIVAPYDSSGTAAVALHLALAVAATQRVLLIDADVHERTLSALCPRQSEAGLVDVAAGHKILSEVVIRDERTNINILSFVSPKSRRLGKMKDEDIKSVFDQTKRFDAVIVAAGGHDSDPSTRFFAGVVDHVLLIVKPGQDGDREIEQAVDALGIDTRKIRGTVVTSSKAA